MINIYCDESCHLELSKNGYDKQKAMVIGGIKCDIEYVKEICEDIKNIKEKHGIYKYNEIKWTKVANGKKEFYKELVEYFFKQEKLEFRCVVFPDKSKLNYQKHDHDDIYNIMYYLLLNKMIRNGEKYSIYVDKKDTRGSEKFKRLRKFLCNKNRDFRMETIEKIQIVDSRDLQLMQLVDLLIGAISYFNRDVYNEAKEGSAKKEIIELIKKLSKIDLNKTSYLSEHKFNVFMWQAWREE